MNENTAEFVHIIAVFLYNYFSKYGSVYFDRYQVMTTHHWLLL